MNCPKCGAEIEIPVVNVQDGFEGCWTCVVGADQMMLRRVVLATETGTEVVLVHARNNSEASAWPALNVLTYYVRSRHRWRTRVTPVKPYQVFLICISARDFDVR